jgi:hypothetical protein
MVCSVIAYKAATAPFRWSMNGAKRRVVERSAASNTLINGTEQYHRGGNHEADMQLLVSANNK